LLGQDEDKLNTVEEIGLFSDDLVIKMGNPLDTLANYMAKRFAYGPNERDIVIMHHNIEYTWPNGVKEVKSIDFIQYGDVNKFTAMAKTVGLPTAIAAKMVLEKEIQTTGMVLPLSKDIYKPILNRLNSEGLTWSETTKILVK
jgi:alpha-aminoadipic semialdehyde synthase